MEKKKENLPGDYVKAIVEEYFESGVYQEYILLRNNSNPKQNKKIKKNNKVKTNYAIVKKPTE